jgi:hypothetical protein
VADSGRVSNNYDMQANHVILSLSGFELMHTANPYDMLVFCIMDSSENTYMRPMYKKFGGIVVKYHEAFGMDATTCSKQAEDYYNIIWEAIQHCKDLA